MVDKLKDSFYVDNCLASFDSLDVAREFTAIASSIMSKRNFNLRGWEITGDPGKEPINVLGILWDKTNDT